MLDKLQKVDKDTNELINAVQKYLFSVGIRTSKERAWDILQTMYKIPFEMLIKRNSVIKYQGQGAHISSKHGAQLMVIKNIGRFEVKGIVNTKTKTKRAKVKYTPSADIQNLANSIEVID